MGEEGNREVEMWLEGTDLHQSPLHGFLELENSRGEVKHVSYSTTIIPPA